MVEGAGEPQSLLHARIIGTQRVVYVLARHGLFFEHEGRSVSWPYHVTVEDSNGTGAIDQVHRFDSQTDMFAHYGESLVID